MKKILIYVLTISLLLCCMLSGCSCKEEEGILPSGKYIIYGEYCRYYEGKDNISYYWEIDGNKASRWLSGYCEYKANVVEENGKIYFYGYKWRDVLQFGRYDGNEYVYEVTYDEKSGVFSYRRNYEVSKK